MRASYNFLEGKSVKKPSVRKWKTEVKNMKGEIRNLSLVLIMLCCSLWGIAQAPKLASQYYNNGEYEKAMSLYGQLYETNKTTDFYFQRYIDCMLNLKKFDQAEKVTQGELKNRPADIQLIVLLGNIYDRKGEVEKAKATYRSAIDKLDNNPQNIQKLAQTFSSLTMYDNAIEVYEKGSKLAPNQAVYYASNLAELYKRTGDEKKMIENYLKSLPLHEANVQGFIQTLERNLTLESISELQKQLVPAIQTRPDYEPNIEILEWSFIYTKAYDRALRQAKARDLAVDGNGAKVYNVAMIALNDEDFETAIDGFRYVSTQKSPTSSYFLAAKRYLLISQQKKITNRFDYTKEDLESLKQDYLTFMKEYGRNTQTANLMMEYAEFCAIYLNDLKEAISTLEEVISFGGVRPEDIAKAKLDLGDFYLMKGERWESSLLYSQVDKQFREGILGEEARYRNAKLSYFSGDFEWAQEQFDILKSATTRLISNDAIYKSVFIMDKLNLDTTAVALQLFAEAELLTFQNLIPEAFSKLDSITLLFPEHSLAADILYAKSSIYKKQRNLPAAIQAYETIMTKYPEDILADDAIMELAKIYDYQLGDPTKAMGLYEKIFLEYSGSTYVIDARKRFRILRGDNI